MMRVVAGRALQDALVDLVEAQYPSALGIGHALGVRAFGEGGEGGAHGAGRFTPTT